MQKTEPLKKGGKSPQVEKKGFNVKELVNEFRKCIGIWAQLHRRGDFLLTAFSSYVASFSSVKEKFSSQLTLMPEQKEEQDTEFIVANGEKKHQKLTQFHTDLASTKDSFEILVESIHRSIHSNGIEVTAPNNSEEQKSMEIELGPTEFDLYQWASEYLEFIKKDYSAKETILQSLTHDMDLDKLKGFSMIWQCDPYRDRSIEVLEYHIQQFAFP